MRQKVPCPLLGGKRDFLFSNPEHTTSRELGKRDTNRIFLIDKLQLKLNQNKEEKFCIQYCFQFENSFVTLLSKNKNLFVFFIINKIIDDFVCFYIKVVVLFLICENMYKSKVVLIIIFFFFFRLTKKKKTNGNCIQDIGNVIHGIMVKRY